MVPEIGMKTCLVVTPRKTSAQGGKFSRHLLSQYMINFGKKAKSCLGPMDIYGN